MKKQLLSLLFALILCLGGTASAQGDITITLNGAVLDSDVPAQIVDGRTMLPMRTVFNAFDANVSWFEADKLIIATKGDSMIAMQIGTNIMSIQHAATDEHEVIELDVPPYISEDRTMVPVRAIAEALDANVVWDEDNRCVVISAQN